MTEHDAWADEVERRISTAVGTPPLPDEFYDVARARVASTRRRPRWLARITEPAMRTSSGVTVGSPTVRFGAIMIATLLLTLAVAGAGLAGIRILEGPAPIVVDPIVVEPIVVDSPAPIAVDPIVVDPNGLGDFTTIAEAVEEAQDGDTIHVRPGTYIEAVTITRDIALLGDGPREEIIIEAPAEGPSTLVDDGRAVRHAILIDGSEATVSGLTLRGTDSAVQARGGEPTIEGLRFEAVGQPHVTLHGRSFPNAIIASEGSRALISENILVDSGPIAIYDDSRPIVLDNELIDGASIIAFTSSDDAVIRGNSISGALLRGIGTYGTGNVLIQGNTITAAAAEGIYVGDGTVLDNTVRDSAIGIWVAPAAAEPKIQGNVLRGNSIGIQTEGESANMIVLKNELVDNRTGIRIAGTDGHYERNTVAGGQTGIAILGSASPTLLDNIVESSETSGLFIGRIASPTLDGNQICAMAAGEHVVHEDAGQTAIDATNTICTDATD